MSMCYHAIFRVTVLVQIGLVGAQARAQLKTTSTAFAPNARPEMLQESGAGEGPVWHVELGLLTSGDGHVMRRSLEGKQEVFLENGGTNGLAFDRKGRLIMCQNVVRRIARLNDGKITVLTDRFQGMKYNQPNDLAFDSQGRIYFTDPKYGPRDTMEMVDPEGKKVEGVYRIDPSGDVERIITHEVDRPNGIAITADDRYLFVADNNNNTVGGARKLWRFELKSSGRVALDSRKLVYDWKKTRGPDGMELDIEGNLYVAAGSTRQNPPYETQEKSTAGVFVFSPQGELIDFAPIPRDECTNVAFGGKDGKSLFVTAGGTLWHIRTQVAGLSHAVQTQ